MRKSFNTYIVIWLIALVIFNLVIFVIPSTIDGAQIINVVKVCAMLRGGFTINDVRLIALANYLTDHNLILVKYMGAFWPCYVCFMFAFIGQLICSIYTFKETNDQKFFYSIPLTTISYVGLVFTLLICSFGMFIPEFPIWLAVTLCIIVFVITLISLLKANLASSIISQKDDEIKEVTSFAKEMTAKAKALWDADKNNDSIRRLYEEFKYCDYKKVNNIHDIINAKYSEIENKINNNEDIKDCVNELISIIKNG